MQLARVRQGTIAVDLIIPGQDEGGNGGANPCCGRDDSCTGDKQGRSPGQVHQPSKLSSARNMDVELLLFESRVKEWPGRAILATISCGRRRRGAVPRGTRCVVCVWPTREVQVAAGAAILYGLGCAWRLG